MPRTHVPEFQCAPISTALGLLARACCATRWRALHARPMPRRLRSREASSSNTVVARRHRTTNQTVGKWRRRFVEHRLAGLYDEPRVGGPRTIPDAAVETVIVRTLETTPKSATHWSTRTMAAKAGMSHAMIGKIWRTFGLKPHLTRSFKLRRIRNSSTRCATLSGSTCIPHAMPWCSRSTRSRKFKRCSVRNLSCPWISGSPNGRRTLRAPWNARSVCGPQCGHRRSPRAVQAEASRPRFRGVPRRDRRERRARTPNSRGAG